MTPVIETARLTLSEPGREDYVLLRDLVADPEVRSEERRVGKECRL